MKRERERERERERDKPKDHSKLPLQPNILHILRIPRIPFFTRSSGRERLREREREKEKTFLIFLCIQTEKGFFGFCSSYDWIQRKKIYFVFLKYENVWHFFSICRTFFSEFLFIRLFFILAACAYWYFTHSMLYVSLVSLLCCSLQMSRHFVKIFLRCIVLS